MNYIWPIMIIFSLVNAIFNGNIESTIAAGFDAAKNSIDTLFSFAGLMCFWSGMLSVADLGGISAGVEKLLRPFTKFLFPGLEKGGYAIRKITQNMTANLLGMGNAATPAGIEAMNELDKLNGGREKPSEEMSIFAVLNTASIGLLPTTVISMRASFGSENPSEIIIPIWISSVLSLAAALVVIKLLGYLKGKKL